MNNRNTQEGFTMTNKLFLSAMTMSLLVPAMVAPMPTEAKVEEVSFTDVTENHIYHDIIYEMKKEGIINGYPDGTFKPSQEIKRSHVVSLLARALPLEPVREGKEFKDVPNSHYYYEDIQKVYRAGIIDGIKDNFNPEQALTRVQMAKILTNAFDLQVKAEYDFADVPSTHWGNQYVRALYSNGITTGSGEKGYFKPNGKVDRAHYAVFLHRLLNVDPNFVPKPIPKPIPKPEPKPEPEPKPVGKYPIPVGQDLTPPKGWTSDTVKQYKNKITEDMLKKSQGAAGTGSYGSLKYPSSVERFLEGVPTLVKYLNEDNNIDWTEEEFLAIVRDLMENGTLYIHPSNQLALYYNYETGNLERAVATFNN